MVRKRLYICPPLCGAETGCFPVVGVELALLFDGCEEPGRELLVAEAGDAALARDLGVLLGDWALGAEEGAKGVEAEEEVRFCHLQGGVENGGLGG